jgi:predicted O-linked N-acetylglucosamine transferase (SPINDLY family)
MNEAVLKDALALRRAGRLAEAAAIYSEILRNEPRHFEALHALGILRYQTGQLAEAERLIGEAVLVNPRAADALYNRGSLLLKLNRREEALSCFDRALAIRPDYVEALGNRGAALMALGRAAEGLADLDRLVSLRPNLPEAWSNRGGALVALERYEDAHASYGRALALRPDYPEARKNRGAIAFRLKHYADALADADAAISFNARNADAWEQRADSLAELNRKDEALASYERLLALKPDSVDALYNRANNLMALRRAEEAARDYAQVLRLDPDYHYAAGNLVFAKLCICDWHDFEEETQRVAEGLRAGRSVSPPFQALVLSPGEAGAAIAARLWSEHGFPAAKSPLWQGERYAHERIRVAYVSANFHDHAVARLMAGVFEHHERARFETNAISFGPDDGGVLRARLAHAFDRFIDVQSEGAEAIARMLREMEIDIAVDLMGFTENSRPGIFAHRAAPVQVTYLGYPGTRGADYLDYLIADAIVAPPEQAAHYAEKLVHLPHSYLPADDCRAIGERVPSRIEAGLPAEGFVFCCFNNVYKITPSIFGIWMRLLREVEKSVLWLSQADASAVRNLKREAEARGVAPDRLVFANFVKSDAEHLARLKLADLFLDTLPYNAHATASDALWAGVPVLTAPGVGFPGRVAASLLRALGMDELIAPSLDPYAALALQLARDPAALGRIKMKLAQHRTTHPLFDTVRFTRDLERAYVAMWERAQRGLPPESFAVGGAP